MYHSWSQALPNTRKGLDFYFFFQAECFSQHPQHIHTEQPCCWPYKAQTWSWQVPEVSRNLSLERNIKQRLNLEGPVQAPDMAQMHCTTFLCNTPGSHLLQPHWPIMNNHNTAGYGTADHRWDEQNLGQQWRFYAGMMAHSQTAGFLFSFVCWVGWFFFFLFCRRQE